MADLFTRSKHNPILRPNPEHPWEAHKIYNPGAIYHEGKYHLFYRARGKEKNSDSTLGYAVSEDGEHFTTFPEPLLKKNPNNPLEERGLEDPRITKIGDTFYMAYAAYDGTCPRLCIATSKDLTNWTQQGKALPNFSFFKMGGTKIRFKEGKPVHFYEKDLPKRKEQSKAGGIFPEKIQGKYWMLFGEHQMWIASSEDGITYEAIPSPFLEAREDTDLFDNIFVEMGPTPIKTEKGWLVLYHGINDAIQYHLGILLLDLEDPTKILYRSKEPIFGPKEEYELSGIVDIIPGAMDLLKEGKEQELKQLLKEYEEKGFMPQVTFTPGAVVVDGMLHLFYGASDEFVCTATAPLQNILDTIPEK